jgi:hypothetical protein
VKECYEQNVGLWEYQKPGAYNDPDMLEVGVGNLNAEQNRSHFALWAMMSAPLILACDTSGKAANGAHEIITNREIIALNQDDIMLQARRISTAGGVDVLVKPLARGEAAVCFFNKEGRENVSASIDLSKLHSAFDSRAALAPADKYLVKTLFEEAPQYVVMGNILCSGKLPGDGVAVFRVRAAL